MDFNRPTEFADYLVYLEAYAPEFPAEDGLTHPRAFADAWKAIEHFIQHTPSAEGKELLRRCRKYIDLSDE